MTNTRQHTLVLQYASCQHVVSSDHKPIKFVALLKDPSARRAGQLREGDTGLAVRWASSG